MKTHFTRLANFCFRPLFLYIPLPPTKLIRTYDPHRDEFRWVRAHLGISLTTKWRETHSLQRFKYAPFVMWSWTW